ncbi:MAG TPA: TatD family hydrolase [Bacillota bacterium]|jgi:TatD DNase family protein|nr:TatD family hydrolase [Bacillota bacterium]HOL10189.1 TatD family hydrolase [Bacillota bacterium]HPO97941.1 TatD family hydrolase [Bacillota bacterium]
MWIDSHCHLNDQAYNETLDQVIALANASNVNQFIVVGYDLESSKRAVRLAQQYDSIWATVGIHPHDAKCWNDETAQEVKELLTEPKVVAVGEIGLDYYYNHSSKEDQIRAFKEQLTIAKEYNKPIIIHNRDAHQDTLDILKKEGVGPSRGVMHCFSGSLEVARECLKLGLNISFAGSLTFNNAHKLREVAASIPIEKILVETDSPYLTPHPHRGQQNSPALVGLVGAKLAEVKGMTLAEVAQITTENCISLFKLCLD